MGSDGKSPVPVGSMPQLMDEAMVLGNPFEFECCGGIVQIVFPFESCNWN
jgi:hypothetical protein